MKRLLLFAMILCIAIPTDATAQRRKSKKNKKQTTKIPVKPKPKKKTPKYADFVNKSTKTDKGLFDVHETKNKFYYEVPNSLLGKEMLLVTRLKDIPSGLGGGYVNAGTKVNTQVVVWEKFKNKILLKVRSYNAVADDEFGRLARYSSHVSNPAWSSSFTILIVPTISSCNVH